MSQHTTPDITVPIVPVTPRSGASKRIPQLEAGDHLDQKTFHERYSAMPESFRAELVEGMVLALEPIANAGKGAVALAPDGYTYRSKDGSRSAHFEHTILLEKGGARIVTKL